MKKTIIILSAIVAVSCGTSKKVSVINYSTPLATTEQVNIYGASQQLPNGLKFIGSLSIGDAGFTTNCSYSDVVTDAQNQARAMGGNCLVITKHTEPNIWSTCHRIKADVYLIKK